MRAHLDLFHQKLHIIGKYTYIIFISFECNKGQT